MTTVKIECTGPDQQQTAAYIHNPRLFIMLGRAVFTEYSQYGKLCTCSLTDFTWDLSMTSCIATGQIITSNKRFNGSGEELYWITEMEVLNGYFELAKWKSTSIFLLSLCSGLFWVIRRHLASPGVGWCGNLKSLYSLTKDDCMIHEII